MYDLSESMASVCASARSPSSPRSSTSANARGRSDSMKRSVPRSVSRPLFTKIPGGSLMLSLADWMKRGVWRSFDSTRRARSSAGAKSNSAWLARLAPSSSP